MSEYHENATASSMGAAAVVNAQSGSVILKVYDKATNLPIYNFKYVINVDNVGDPQVNIPVQDRDPSLFPSLKPGASHSPVVMAGESNGTGFSTVSLPEGKYIITILSTGYKLGGNWVTVSANTTVETNISLYSNPLPLSKIRVHVFNDNSPVNGEDDFPLESGLDGFLIIIDDAVGEVTVDYFGNPLGTSYKRDLEGNLIFDQAGNPVPIQGTGGKVLTDENGDALIDNIPPGKYEVQAIPPDGTDWVQTTTIEGTHIIDAWIEEGNDGYSPREGFKVPLVWIGFVKPMEFVNPNLNVGSVTGKIRTVIEFVPPFRPLTLGEPVYRPWIALSDIGANDRQVYTGRGNPDGTFTINNVPPGIYQMAIWDEPLDYIIAFRTVEVASGQAVVMGDIGIPRWYGYIKGTVFNDTNENGVLDPGETGISNVGLNTRFKDGSIQYSTISDMQGSYLFNEVFELERFAVAEVGFTRFAVTGATGTPDYEIPVPHNTGCQDSQGNYVRCPETYMGALTLAELTWAAKANRIDWGKRPYKQGENGGISGVVYYAAMRNETDPRYELVEPYEPGIPDVAINLYATEVDSATGYLKQGALLQSVTADSWTHPTGCIDHNGNPVECLEVPNISNQIRPGVFDGGYMFSNVSNGVYIVEVVPPAGYKGLDENGSANTDQGDSYYAPTQGTANMAQEIGVEQYPALIPADICYNLAAPMYFDINKRVVRVSEGLNAAADFFIYTDVPVPGRIVGFLLDDVNLETDPAFLYYGEKRGIPDTPIGIRDFKGRLIKTVYSDINGIFEVLLPSTYTRNVPTPSGVAPGMYQIIGNDPGDPDSPDPHYNPNYQTLKLVFDVWPGKTTYADVALFPITAFVGTPGAQFSQPPQCKLAADIPQIFSVDKAAINVLGSTAERTVTIYGTGFGNSAGTVTLNSGTAVINSWSDYQITFEVPYDYVFTGLAQLMVSNQSGNTSHTGLSMHLLKQFAPNQYWPKIVEVKKDGNGDYMNIQAAIDGENDGTVVVVYPGIYNESPILYKNIKLQGMGAGGIRFDNSYVEGTVVDGRYFLSYIDEWLQKLASIDYDSPTEEIPRGQVFTIAAKNGAFSEQFRPQLDGFMITGARGEEGGGIYVNAYGRYLLISNNIIQSNGGGFGGGITIGKAYVGDNFNDDIHIHHNRVLNNGGISLAGGIGIFNGADNYIIEHNDICGNYSAEYGGGISHFGYSNGGIIRCNDIMFNASFDEGAGVFVGGEQPIPPQTLTEGSGSVSIYNNLIKGNVANDDGGGIRILQPREYLINIYNNMIVNNVSTDLGGGIALDDASNVVIVNNTISKNITTATAEDSDDLAHAAGIASELHSAAFMAFLNEYYPGSPNYSNPVLFNNILWDNRAGVYDQTMNGGTGGIRGISSADKNVIDLEVFGSNQLFEPMNCDITQSYSGGSSNIYADPLFVEEYDTQVTAVAFNMEPDFKSVKIVTVSPEPIGNYHITSSSPVIDQGTWQITRDSITYTAPSFDFDNETRPQNLPPDIGADEYNSAP